MIKTKIIATLGPASRSPETIQKLLDQGVNIFRLNFSHGTLEQHQQVLDSLQPFRKDNPSAFAVMGDLCGPKIRTRSIAPEWCQLKEGQTVAIVPDLESGTAERFGTNYAPILRDVRPGHRILIDDGQIELTALVVTESEITARVVVPGPVYSHKGINLPDSHVSAPSITDQDWRCVDWAVKHKLDFLALSFVRAPDEISRLKSHLQKSDSPIKVVAKLEKPEAIQNLDAILQACDVALVARGDLGVEMDLAEVPLIQKRITQLCRQAGKPVIVATQMLQSMIESPSPTRAEVSDVANAIMDLADAVMLSGETATGKHPLEAVQTIRRIACKTEKFLDEHDLVRLRAETSTELLSTAAVSRSVAQIVEDINAKLVFVWSQTGSASRLLSKSRIDVPIVAMSCDLSVCRQMCMSYGVIPLYHPVPKSMTAFQNIAKEFIDKFQWAKTGDTVVLMAGRPLTAPGVSNNILIHTLGSENGY